MRRRSFLRLLSLLLLNHAGICSPLNPNFSGVWSQSNERCIPKRTGNVTLQIDHHDPQLDVRTTIVPGSGAPRQALQRYSTDGKVSTSTGADGDEFHTSIGWENQSLVFSVEEHEDGRILLSKETWTLRENGTVLERVRERVSESPGSTEKQTLIYLRQASQT